MRYIDTAMSSFNTRNFNIILITIMLEPWMYSLLPVQWLCDNQQGRTCRHLEPLCILAPHYHGSWAPQDDPRWSLWTAIPIRKHRYPLALLVSDMEASLLEEGGYRRCQSMLSEKNHWTQQCLLCRQKKGLTRISPVSRCMHIDLHLVQWNRSPEPTLHYFCLNHIGYTPTVKVSSHYYVWLYYDCKLCYQLHKNWETWKCQHERGSLCL